jgi:hypothetical protein
VKGRSASSTGWQPEPARIAVAAEKRSPPLETAQGQCAGPVRASAGKDSLVPAGLVPVCLASGPGHILGGKGRSRVYCEMHSWFVLKLSTTMFKLKNILMTRACHRQLIDAARSHSEIKIRRRRALVTPAADFSPSRLLRDGGQCERSFHPLKIRKALVCPQSAVHNAIQP